MRMAGGTRLPLSKTSRYCVFDSIGKAGVAAAKCDTSSQGKQQATRPRAHVNSGGEGGSNNADSQQLPATERLYMLDTYLMKAGEASCARICVLL